MFFDVSTSGYYDWRERQPSARAIEDVELKQKIQQIFTEYKGRYDSPRIFKTLQKLGYNIGKKRVERLYCALGLVAGVTTALIFFIPWFVSFFVKQFVGYGEVKLAQLTCVNADLTNYLS